MKEVGRGEGKGRQREGGIIKEGKNGEKKYKSQSTSTKQNKQTFLGYFVLFLVQNKQIMKYIGCPGFMGISK